MEPWNGLRNTNGGEGGIRLSVIENSNQLNKCPQKIWCTNSQQVFRYLLPFCFKKKNVWGRYLIFVTLIYKLQLNSMAKVALYCTQYGRSSLPATCNLRHVTKRAMTVISELHISQISWHVNAINHHNKFQRVIPLLHENTFRYRYVKSNINRPRHNLFSLPTENSTFLRADHKGIYHLGCKYCCLTCSLREGGERKVIQILGFILLPISIPSVLGAMLSRRKTLRYSLYTYPSHDHRVLTVIYYVSVIFTVTCDINLIRKADIAQ